MSYERMLVDRCEVFHIVSQADVVKFGVPTNTKPTYGTVADISDVHCYFSKSTRSQASIIQGDPNAFIMETLNVQFLKTEDIRINDRIVFKGENYKAKLPRLVRSHHIEVEVERIKNL